MNYNDQNNHCLENSLDFSEKISTYTAKAYMQSFSRTGTIKLSITTDDSDLISDPSAITHKIFHIPGMTGDPILDKATVKMALRQPEFYRALDEALDQFPARSHKITDVNQIEKSMIKYTTDGNSVLNNFGVRSISSPETLDGDQLDYNSINSITIRSLNANRPGDIGVFAAPSESSMDYMVLKDGRVVRLVDPINFSWNTNPGKWAETPGETDGRLNNWNPQTIAVSFQTETSNYTGSFSAEEVDAGAALIKYLSNDYPQIRYLVAASDVTPFRLATGRAPAQDPGANFPWHELFEKGVGLGVTSAQLHDEENISIASRYGYSEKGGLSMVYALRNIGYDIPTPEEVGEQMFQRVLDQAARSFQQHFVNTSGETPEYESWSDQSGVAALLIEQQVISQTEIVAHNYACM